MSIYRYRQYRKTLKTIPRDGRMMPYRWGDLPDPLSGQWMAYSTMFIDFSRELANGINAFTRYVQQLRAWAKIVASLTDRQKMEVTLEFVDTLATVAVNMPYVLRSRLIFATAHLCHQANMTKCITWRDDLPLDKEIYFATADKCGSPWSKYNDLKRCLEAVAGQEFRDGTHDFRNAYNHRFSPRFVIGFTNFAKRIVDKNSQSVTYGFGDKPALELSDVAQLLTKERDRCYAAFDAFQALIREQEGSIKQCH